MNAAIILASLSAGALAIPQGYTFSAYLKEFGKSYAGDEYILRESIFQERLADMLEHNAGHHAYTLAVNNFFDLTDTEISAFRGYKKGKPGLSGAVSAEAPRLTLADVAALPDSVDWRTSGAVTAVKNQGSCGSCWAFASTETLESHWFLKTGKSVTLAPQQLVDCTPNPQHCGGTGGCEGATAELAYQYLTNLTKNGGLTSESNYPYRARDGKCNDANVPSVAAVSGFVRLTENSYDEVMNAVANIGPLAVAVDASHWSFYGGGIFNGCSNNANIDIDHLVQLVGYGVEKDTPYWLVRNSWGASWGESGYIRLMRHNTSDYCGKDNTPLDGSGCEGGPTVVEVCGECGIVYDTVYPLIKA